MITLVDTSAWIEALRKNGEKQIREQVRSLLESGDARITEPVLTEIYNGARGDREISYVREMEKTIPMLPCNQAVFSLSWELARTCRQKGLTLPPIDIIIFATANFYKANLLHRDSHFEKLASL